MQIKILLSEPGRQLIRELHEQLALNGFGDIRQAHSQVFQYMKKDGSRITELAERAQMTKQSMSVLVYDMEKAGYLKRYPDPNDKRAYIFKLTESGQKSVETAGRIIHNIIDGWQQRLGEQKMNDLLQLLTELNEVIAIR